MRIRNGIGRERKGVSLFLSRARLVARPLLRLPPWTEFLEQAEVMMDVWLKHWTTKYNKESKGQIYGCKYMQIYETNIKVPSVMSINP